MGRPFKCPYCGEEGRSVCKGFRRTKTMGKRRIRLCKACGRKFTPRNQKPEEQPRQQEVTQGETGPESDGTGKAPTKNKTPQENEASGEPAGALARMFPPPDEQWTS